MRFAHEKIILSEKLSRTFSKKSMKKVNIVIIEMAKTSVPKEFELIISINNVHKSFLVSIIDDDGILGVSLGDELESLISHSREYSRLFIKSILNLYQDNSLSLPIEIGELEV
jgi:hypothetical protein